MKPQADQSKLKSATLTILKIGLVMAIFTWLISKGHLDLRTFTNSKIGNWAFLAFTLLCIVCNIMLQTYRTRILFQAQQYEVPYASFLKITWICCFFSTFLPGGITSDVVKYGYLQRYLQRSRAVTALTLFMDRATGLIMLIAVSFLASLAMLTLFPSEQSHMEKLALFSGGLLTCSGVLGVVAMHQNSRHFFLLRPLQRFQTFHLLMNAIEEFKTHKKWLGVAMLFSMAGHLISLTGIYFLQYMFYDPIPFSFMQVLLIFPTAMLVSIIPIAPQGLGVSQVILISAATILNLPSPSAAVTIFTAMQIAVIFTFLSGAIPYIGYKQKAMAVTP